MNAVRALRDLLCLVRLRVLGTFLQGLYVFARRAALRQSRTILYSMQLYVQINKLIIDEITVFLAGLDCRTASLRLMAMAGSSQ
ncbi:MAG: hypothetical protein WCJ17_01455 [bacterium]